MRGGRCCCQLSTTCEPGRGDCCAPSPALRLPHWRINAYVVPLYKVSATTDLLHAAVFSSVRVATLLLLWWVAVQLYWTAAVAWLLCIEMHNLTGVQDSRAAAGSDRRGSNSTGGANWEIGSHSVKESFSRILSEKLLCSCHWLKSSINQLNRSR